MQAKHNFNEAVPPLVWVIDSAYTGEMNARIGVAKRLGYPYQIISMPNGDIKSYRQMLKDCYSDQTNGSQPKLVIISGTGEETTAEIADLKQLFADSLLNVYLASILPEQCHPRLAEYDIIASTQLSGSNIINLVCVPHHLTQELLASAYQQHEDYFNSLPKPIIGLLLGGNTRYCNGFNEHYAAGLAQRVINIAKPLGGSVIISNSRRTPEAAVEVLLNNLQGLHYSFFNWLEIEQSFYHAILAHADFFIVTGDSLSMCSEACYTGKPLLIDLSYDATESYHQQIVGNLVDHGVAKFLTERYEPWSYQAPDPVGEVALAIQNRVK